MNVGEPCDGKDVLSKTAKAVVQSPLCPLERLPSFVSSCQGGCKQPVQVAFSGVCFYKADGPDIGFYNQADGSLVGAIEFLRLSESEVQQYNEANIAWVEVNPELFLEQFQRTQLGSSQKPMVGVARSSFDQFGRVCGQCEEHRARMQRQSEW